MRHLLSICAALLCAAGLAAGIDMTSLKVQVLDASSGKPIDRASVIVIFIKGRSKIKIAKFTTTWETKTNQEGVAKLPPFPQGMIRIQIIAENHQTFGNVFDVDEAEKTIQIKLNPPQAQYSAH